MSASVSCCALVWPSVVKLTAVGAGVDLVPVTSGISSSPADGPAEVSEGLPATVDTATLTDEQVRRLMAEPGMQEVMSAEDFPAEASPWAFRQMFPTIDRQYLPEPATTHRSQREEPQA